MKGIFITFEGIDGSGKTTQIKLLADYLQKKGYGVVVTREPGGTQIGDKIREILLDPSNKGMSVRTETFLFEASRAEIVEKVINPALSRGKIVICDRFFDSTIAYQGIARGLGIKTVLDMSLWATGGLVPDITFLLSADRSECDKRMKVSSKKPDRIENEEEDFKQKLQEGYQQLADNFGGRVVALNGSLPVSKIFQLIKTRIKELL
jgi:dTMP kinase